MAYVPSFLYEALAIADEKIAEYRERIFIFEARKEVINDKIDELLGMDRHADDDEDCEGDDD